MRVRVQVVCERCGHVNDTVVEATEELPMSEMIEEAPLRQEGELPISEMLDDDE